MTHHIFFCSYAHFTVLHPPTLFAPILTSTQLPMSSTHTDSPDPQPCPSNPPTPSHHQQYHTPTAFCHCPISPMCPPFTALPFTSHTLVPFLTFDPSPQKEKSLLHPYLRHIQNVGLCCSDLKVNSAILPPLCSVWETSHHWGVPGIFEPAPRKPLHGTTKWRQQHLRHRSGPEHCGSWCP